MYNKYCIYANFYKKNEKIFAHIKKKQYLCTRFSRVRLNKYCHAAHENLGLAAHRTGDRLYAPTIITNVFSMYAIVEMKGQQFRVEAGKKLFINRMNELEKGATVEFENVLLLDNEGKVKVGAPYVKGAKVVCEVLDNECRGEKILVFHKKRRKGYRKLNGHRQDLTNVVVKEIVIA